MTNLVFGQTQGMTHWAVEYMLHLIDATRIDDATLPADPIVRREVLFLILCYERNQHGGWHVTAEQSALLAGRKFDVTAHSFKAKHVIPQER